MRAPPATPARSAACRLPWRLSVALAALTLQACYTVPMAPLVYGSKTTGGLDISTGGSANPSVSVSIGYKRDDIALVPVAVREDSSKGDEKLIVVPGGGPGPRTRGNIRDSMSVFGIFEGRGMGDTAAQSTRLDARAANYFSTGIAAQELARGFGAAQAARQVTLCLEQVKSIADTLTDAAKKEDFHARGLAACAAGHNLPAE
ncbi:MAG: hypothetical protein EYC67_07370 [Betaproteobacteria bacterium]|nr:MAG: hypothetical protein EYC67_07370 [Betaproteobacteria bacterium]